MACRCRPIGGTQGANKLGTVGTVCVLNLDVVGNEQARMLPRHGGVIEIDRILDGPADRDFAAAGQGINLSRLPRKNRKLEAS
jgi:hypothetical protein